MKKAFTMIELIFVIVLIGILAAVAIPKLSATRDDASVVKIVHSAVNALQNLGTSYTSRANYSIYSVAEANSEVECFSYTAATAEEGNITVHLKPNCINTTVREAVASLAVQNGLLGANAVDKVFQFGGERVRF